MAFAITNTNGNVDPNFIGVPPVVQLTDLTASSTAQAIAPNSRTFRAIVYLKTYAVGNDTVGPLFQLQVADTSAFNTTNVISVDRATTALVATSSSNGGYVYLLEGTYPFIAGANYAKVLVTFSGTGSGTYDALIWSA